MLDSLTARNWADAGPCKLASPGPSPAWLGPAPADDPAGRVVALACPSGVSVAATDAELLVYWLHREHVVELVHGEANLETIGLASYVAHHSTVRTVACVTRRAALLRAETLIAFPGAEDTPSYGLPVVTIDDIRAASTGWRYPARPS